MSVPTNQNTTNYYIILTDKLSTIQFYLQRVNIPGIISNAIEDLSFGRTIKIPGDSLAFEDLSFDILLDKELKTYEEVYDNIIGSNNPQTGLLTPSKKIFQATLVISTHKNNPEVKFIFDNVIIERIGSIQLDVTASGNIVLPVSCTFTNMRFFREE